jgi:hypothetical protein
MDFILNFLDNGFFNSISTTMEGYLQQGVDLFKEQDILIQVAVLFGGAIIIFLGTFDLLKKLSKLFVIAIIVFALWFIYTNYFAG